MTKTQRNVGAGLVVAAVLAAAYVVVSRKQPRAAPPERASASAPGRPRGRVPGSRALPGTAVPAAAPAASASAHAQVRGKAVEAFLQHTRYPDDSRPVEELAPNLFDNTVPPVELSSGAHGIVLKQTQDESFVTGGMTATVGLTVLVGGTPRSIDVPAAELRTARGPIGTAKFADDGSAPDATSRDGTYTAVVRFPADTLGDYVGKVTLSTLVRLDQDEVPVDFGFTATGKPPARFTGKVVDKQVEGSLQLRIGVAVEKAGQYAFVGVAKDSTGKPVARMQKIETLDAGAHDVILRVYGKLVRDARAQTPLVVDRVDGWRIGDDDDGGAERQMMLPLTALHRTRAYALDSFTDKDWDSPEKRQQLEQLRGGR